MLCELLAEIEDDGDFCDDAVELEEEMLELMAGRSLLSS